MKAVLVKALADLKRRRVQGLVILVIVALASGTGTLALTLIAQTQDPFQRAFTAQRGAHLQVFYSGKSDPALLASTTRLVGASDSAGPWLATDIRLARGSEKLNGITVTGRDNPGGRVEQLRLSSGRWVSAPGEIVLTRSFADLNHLSVGDRLRAVSIASRPELTLVGEVVDIDEGTADLSGQNSWVLESQLAALAPPDDSWFKMVYRFPGDPSDAQLRGKVDELQSQLPPGTIAGSVNYKLIGSVFNITNTILTSVLFAFSAFALAATAAIVATLVTGIVIAGYREIGIMKAIGFTPFQVVGALVLQVLVPAIAGCLVGIPVGTLLSQPLLANSSRALGLAPQTSVSPVLLLVAMAGTLAVVVIASALPSLRAGLLRPARVLSAALAPPGGGGAWLRRLAARAGLPRPVSLGMGEAFARPLRGSLTVVAVLVGAATVLVSSGLATSFRHIQDSETGVGRYQVVVNRSPALPDSQLMQLLINQPETQRVVAIDGLNLAIPGIGNPVNSLGFRGDSATLGYSVITGRWFSGPGEVVAPKALLRDAHLKVGDSFTATGDGKSARLTVVGELYDISNLGHEVFGDWSLVTAFRPDDTPARYFITLLPGSDAKAYVKRLGAAQPDFVDAHTNDVPLIGPIQIVDSVLLVLAIILGLIAAAGVFNTLLLNTRERLRDTAILKAVGMEPRQVVIMVGSTAALLALLGGLAALPVGLALHHLLLDAINGASGNETPPSSYGAFNPVGVALIPVGAVALAVVAALLPGRWAARTAVVEVLHSE